MSTISFGQLTTIMSRDTAGKFCIEIEFSLTGNARFSGSWMGKMPSKEHGQDIYWFGLPADGGNSHHFLTFEEMASAPVFDGKCLRQVWDGVEVLSLDGCDPAERLDFYLMCGSTFVRKRFVPLGRIAETEKWLDQMAQEGNTLCIITGRGFHFQKGTPQYLHHFLLDPERGNNSSGWVFYEFLQNGATQLKHTWPSFFCPGLVLYIQDDLYRKDKERYDYYYRYRDYRLYRRLVANIAVAATLCAAILVLSCIDPGRFVALSPYGLGSFIVGVHHAVSLMRFLRDCKRLGRAASWKKPRRPGYGG